MNRSGFALIAVLWTVALLASIVGLGAGVARIGLGATSNRITLTRARWAAEACLAIAQTRVLKDSEAYADTVDLGRALWCSWVVRQPDGRLDVNAASPVTLKRLAEQVGLDTERARRFSDGVVFARRTNELTDVRQLESLPGAELLLAYLTVDGSGTVDALAAPQPVLASLPGLTGEAIDEIIRRRTSGTPIMSIDELGGALSSTARVALSARYSELTPVLRFGSSRLHILADGWDGSRGLYPRVTVDLVVERLPDRLAVLRRRVR